MDRPPPIARGDVIGLRLHEAHAHQPTQRIERVRPAAEQGRLLRLPGDPPVIVRATAHDVGHVVQIFALAVEDLAERPLGDQALHVAQTEGVADLVAEVILQPASIGQRDDRPAFLDRRRHRDFREDVLARLQGHDRVPTVQVIGCGDHDHLHRSIGQQSLVLRVVCRDAAHAGHALRQRGIRVADRDDARLLEALERLQVRLSLPQSDYPHPDRGHRNHHPVRGYRVRVANMP